jgi:hypothetical protein
MTGLVKKVAFGAVLGATVVMGAAPAQAQYYDRYRDRDATGAAIVAGIAGLAIGAALAGSDDRRYYDRRYYYRDGYYPYYRDRYYPRNRYHYRDYRRYRGWDRCGVRRVYDPYLGRTVRVRYCR